MKLEDILIIKPKKVIVFGEIFELLEDAPLCLMYRNINDKDDFLIRDYSIRLDEKVELYTRKRSVKKVKCIETNKVFSSPAKAGRYYGFADGDMISKVCRGVHETAKGLHFEYLEEK